MNDTLLNKKVSIERCLAQVERYCTLDTTNTGSWNWTSSSA